MAPRSRNTFKYRFISPTGEELHCGLTNNLDRREGEHRRGFEEPDGYIEQVGRRTTRVAAQAWERKQRCSPFDRELADDVGIDAGDLERVLVAAGAVVGLGVLARKLGEMLETPARRRGG